MATRITRAAGASALLLTLGMLLGAGTATASESVRITDDSVRITDAGPDNCIYREHILGC